VTVALAVEPAKVADLAGWVAAAGDPYDVRRRRGTIEAALRRLLAAAGPLAEAARALWPEDRTQPMVPENRGEQGENCNRGCAPVRPPGEGRGHG
jgi:hypothetical protein